MKGTQRRGKIWRKRYRQLVTRLREQAPPAIKRQKRRYARFYGLSSDYQFAIFLPNHCGIEEAGEEIGQGRNWQPHAERCTVRAGEQ